MEDNPGDIVLLREMLIAASGSSCAVTTASSLAAAISLLAAQAPDCVLLDLSLPDSHGLETIDRLCAAAPSMPIVVMTGLTDEKVAMEAVRRGAQDYMVKGWTDGRTLVRAIHYAMDRKQAAEALRKAHDELEMKVRERTADLKRTVDSLQEEVRQRQEAESELSRLNRVLRMLSECNAALVRIESEPELIQEICRIILNVGGYRMVWVGYAEQDEAKSVSLAGAVGLEEGYIERARISWGDSERGRGPTGSAIRLGQPRIGQDLLSDPELLPWREEALKRGFRSSVAVPLSFAGQRLGALTIYSAQPGAFDEAQVRVLCELADDLAFGIMALRTRTALRESQQRLTQVVHSAPVVIWAVDRQGMYTVVEGRLAHSGLQGGDLVGKSFYETQADRADLQRHVRLAMAGEEITDELEAGGFVYESRYSPVRGPDSEITGVLCVSTDITERRRVEREVLAATGKERRRLGRDLHDTIQGSLAGIGYMLAALKMALARKPLNLAKVAADAEEIGKTVRDTIAQTRGLARGLCPVELKADGLMRALAQLADTTTGVFRTPCQFLCPVGVLVHDETVATQLYYIALEGINNALKHAKAQQITLRMLAADGQLNLAIEDDGVGIPESATPAGGMGLRTMSYRAKTIGATLHVHRREERGTAVECSVRGPFLEIPPAQA